MMRSRSDGASAVISWSDGARRMASLTMIGGSSSPVTSDVASPMAPIMRVPCSASASTMITPAALSVTAVASSSQDLVVGRRT